MYKLSYHRISATLVLSNAILKKNKFHLCLYVGKVCHVLVIMSILNEMFWLCCQVCSNMHWCHLWETRTNGNLNLSQLAIVSKCLNIKLGGITFTEKGINHRWFSFHLVFSQAGGSYQETVQTLIKAMKNAEVSKALIYSFHC